MNPEEKSGGRIFFCPAASNVDLFELLYTLEAFCAAKIK